MKFVDYVEIEVEGGKGGDGIVAFRREKYVSMGGPSGGDGGKGGDVVVEADENIMTLHDYKYMKKNVAPNGNRGEKSKRTGKSGEDLVIKVPVGTIVKDKDSGEILADLTEHKERFIVAKGGNGGAGNQHFATSTNKAPKIAKPGKPGEKRKIIFELKVLADIGLVGYPNAGKSTFLSVVTKAKPKIADYPFTTLHPNLGIYVKDFRSFLIADIPGLIDGAAEGKGLGDRFLRHVERSKLLLFLIPINEKSLKEQFKSLRNELKAYSEIVAEKEFVIAFTKIDVLNEDELKEKKIEIEEEFKGNNYYFISSITREGLDELLNNLLNRVEKFNRNSEEIIDV